MCDKSRQKTCLRNGGRNVGDGKRKQRTFTGAAVSISNCNPSPASRNRFGRSRFKQVVLTLTVSSAMFAGLSAGSTNRKYTSLPTDASRSARPSSFCRKRGRRLAYQKGGPDSEV